MIYSCKHNILSGLLMVFFALSVSAQGENENWHIPDLSGKYKAHPNSVFVELADSIPIRGTLYRIRVPKNWNGFLISDLDYYKSADSHRNVKLLEMGYALSGTKRRADRMLAYDPAHEIHDLISVLDIFEANFGKPRRTIQLGCSGGGTVTIAMAEIHPDRIDGAIALCGATSPWMANTHLDGLFVLKALLAPELPILDIPLKGLEMQKIAQDWQEVVRAAQQTPEGRARIALAITIGQWQAWGGKGEAPVPNPNLKNTMELQKSMYESLVGLLPSRGTFGTTMIELAAPGQIKWNTGVDYREFYKNGNELYKKTVEKLYKEAGISLRGDIDKINDFPRYKADASAKQWWSKPGRTHIGEPKIPFLRLSTSGDGLVYPAMVKGYEDLVAKNGYSELYRSAYVNRWGHCTFTVGEWLAAIETLKQRLNSGVWPSTKPASLNKLSKKLDPDSKAEYFKCKTVKKYNRTWVPGIEDFIGDNE
ncbi:alpha/beta hydrolase [Seonamhaeicola maritimus]|uniref:alpha/beta hydrolase n=1 Tax=Seonamhaeicola maritimus TaxID=2591822 RepID=UPI0024942A1F|nr:alpha/beta hydrolase [Seonamhaeicola maritimus]